MTHDTFSVVSRIEIKHQGSDKLIFPKYCFVSALFSLMHLTELDKTLAQNNLYEFVFLYH